MKALPTEILSELQSIDFDKKGEGFVEACFFTPLLECLGYEKHKDYEVKRHGDEGASFKLNYPPVERGAKRVKHYNPDYIPTIRKKVFWIGEAKSPRETYAPFEHKYVVQGLQYCIHPEIQAKYLVLSNGIYTTVYEPKLTVFLDEKSLYDPILVVCHRELIEEWDELYRLISVEKMRDLIEADMRIMYEKLSLSSLNKEYPKILLNRIGKNKLKLARAIDKHVASLKAAAFEKDFQAIHNDLESCDLNAIRSYLELPMQAGKPAALYFVEKAVLVINEHETFNEIIRDYQSQSIFRKEHTFAALCTLHNITTDSALKERIKQFIDDNQKSELPLLNIVECACLRVVRKLTVILTYPELKESIAQELKTASEHIQFVYTPTALQQTIEFEIQSHRSYFNRIKRMGNDELNNELEILMKIEKSIQDDYYSARNKLDGNEIQISGFEHFGLNRQYHPAFATIVQSMLK